MFRPVKKSGFVVLLIVYTILKIERLGNCKNKEETLSMRPSHLNSLLYLDKKL